MIQLKLKNRKGQLNINSKEVKDILNINPDIDLVEDISNTINQRDMMVFDCKLTEDFFTQELANQIIEEFPDEIDESFFELLFDDIRALLKDTTDEIESELQERYLVDHIRCCYDIYRINDEFTDFKFVFVVSFKETTIAELENLIKIISKRQLGGASKFYS